MRIRDVVIDVWSWLNYKPVMANPRKPGGPLAELASTWVPDEDLRRLSAYKLLAAYDQGQAGQLAAASTGDDTALGRRELGDASKLIETVLGYLLGTEQTIIVPGAEHADDEQPPAGAVEAAEAQERLRKWAEKELLELRMQQTERSAVRCGDAVYTLAWEPSKGRALLRSYDPGFYFPEWPEDGEMDAAEYPRRVHFAWDLPEDQAKGLKARVRRITYELGPIGAATKPGATKDGIPRREWIYGTGGDPVLIVGDKVNADTGTISRTYPWAPGKPSGITCYLTDAEWLLEDLKGSHTVYTLPEDKAAFRVRSDGEVLERLDLMVDFIPVVHITNSIPEPGEHWGRPALAPILQGLDELSATDTDAAAAAGTTGAPVVSVSGARIGVDRTTGQPKPLALAPGSVFQLADGGRMDVLNTAPQLAELRERTDHLIDRIAVNSRVTSAGLGTLDPTALPSGYALQLALGPLDSLVGSMRLARAHKYALLLRMATRLHQAGQVWPAGETPSARIMFGPHTPTDRAAILEEVVKAYEAGIMSLETGVRMLMDAGYPVEDAQEEIDRIQARAFAAAGLLADATGDNAVVREFLGLPEVDLEIGPVPLVPEQAPPGREPTVN
ncbi:hypothetical protein [Streptomyces beijiangensis]|uniref:Phage portal protein, SPP1 Gp6-like n=1 Tax=Streptomyces beijiangensis TaxID=163361 RepID=A0A939JFI2_9ACTN|nr:hypothetical protein [Streptomyces beijiangensis]MBO0512418.1 hypothetical protein [Streptomyces beijiangensis]